MKKHERISKYCCIGMYGAVEMPEIAGVTVNFGWFRDDKVWDIRLPGQTEGVHEIGYCPWCGARLPNKPFIEEKNEAG